MPTTKPLSPRNDIPALFGWLALCALVAFAGSMATLSAPEFYRQLQRPAWSPPAWIFGPVWTTLYAMMAIAAWLTWRQGAAWRGPLGWFLAQLVLNGLWSWVFFAWQQGALALANIVALWVLIVVCMGGFMRYSRPAGWLLAPYLGWVSFATLLTYAVWRANPGLL